MPDSLINASSLGDNREQFIALISIWIFAYKVSSVLKIQSSISVSKYDAAIVHRNIDVDVDIDAHIDINTGCLLYISVSCQ